MKQIGSFWLKTLAIGFLVAVGLVCAHHPMILSGLTKIQADPVDPRLINYILEHTYCWLIGTPLHDRLWDPPIYFSTPNVLAYSDTFLTAAPVYWVWRICGLEPDTSYQLWALSSSTLNFLAMFVFLRHGLYSGTCGAAAGAFLFAFAAPRVNQVAHTQLYTQYFSVLTLFALVLAFSRRNDSTWKRTIWWCLASVGLAAQTYASFYLGWFLVLGLALAALGSVALPSLRKPLLSLLKWDVLPILTAGVVGILAIWPLFQHAKAAANELGYRTYYEAFISIPDWLSWVYQGPQSWLYSWPLRGIPLEHEHRLGFGLATPLAAGIGLYLGRSPAAKVASLGALGLWLSVTKFGPEMMHNLAILMLAMSVTWLVLNRMNDQVTALVTVSSLVQTLVLIPWEVLMIAAPFLVVGGLAAWFLERKGYGTRLWVYILAVFIAFSCFVTYSDSLANWLPGTLAVMITAFILHRRGLGIPINWLFGLGLLLASVCFLTGFTVILWNYFFLHVFGANAIRAVGRVSLVLLIPASVGLAVAFDALWQRGRRAAVCLLALICLLEQGVTTDSYDKFVQRRYAHDVAVRVPADSVAFFAGKLHEQNVTWEMHLDAMWAELECHVPTINGYSGGQPQGWARFYEGNGSGLGEWATRHGLPLNRVCWIGGKAEDYGLLPPNRVDLPH